MIEYRPAGTRPIRFRGPASGAYLWLLRRITTDDVVRGLVKGFESLGGPLNAKALLNEPRMTPWIFFNIGKVSSEYIGTGFGGAPTLGRDVDVEVVPVVAGSDPADSLKIWDAIVHAIGSRTAEAMQDMWTAGVSGVQPIVMPTDVFTTEKEPMHSAAPGVIRVIV